MENLEQVDRGVDPTVFKIDIKPSKISPREFFEWKRKKLRKISVERERIKNISKPYRMKFDLINKQISSGRFNTTFQDLSDELSNLGYEINIIESGIRKLDLFSSKINYLEKEMNKSINAKAVKKLKKSLT